MSSSENSPSTPNSFWDRWENFLDSKMVDVFLTISAVLVVAEAIYSKDVTVAILAVVILGAVFFGVKVHERVTGRNQTCEPTEE